MALLVQAGFRLTDCLRQCWVQRFECDEMVVGEHPRDPTDPNLKSSQPSCRPKNAHLKNNPENDLRNNLMNRYQETVGETSFSLP